MMDWGGYILDMADDLSCPSFLVWLSCDCEIMPSKGMCPRKLHYKLRSPLFFRVQLLPRLCWRQLELGFTYSNLVASATSPSFLCFQSTPQSWPQKQYEVAMKNTDSKIEKQKKWKRRVWTGQKTTKKEDWKGIRRQCSTGLKGISG